MTLNFSKHENSIRDAYEKIATSSSSDEWVILEYEGTSNVIRVGDRGEDGLDEFCSSFSSGKLQYGVISIRLSANVPKIVLVHWQGEGVPSARLASTTSHINDVRKYLKTVHLIQYARSEMDVDPDSLRKEVAKLPGAIADSNVESTFSVPTAVGSVYAPVKPHVDVNIGAREKFWNSVNNEEAQRKAEDSKIHAEREKRWATEREQIADAIHLKSVQPPSTRDQNATREEKETKPAKNLVSSRVNHFSTGVVDPGYTKSTMTNSNIREESGLVTARLTGRQDDKPTKNTSAGLRAVALWDYQAADGTEISFDPDDIITDIVKVDEGWWSGKTKDGKIGLFPSNFVTLLA